MRRLATRQDNKLHVLVCAPSNSALDEIVYRIIHSGLSDARGDTYIPSIVRVGVQPHHSIHSVSMESLIRGRMESTERTAAGRGTAGRGKQERDRVRINILDEASIVASTLAFSGSSMFSRMTRNFDVVVIDEAAQAVEPSTMVRSCRGPCSFLPCHHLTPCEPAELDVCTSVSASLLQGLAHEMAAGARHDRASGDPACTPVHS
jgi:senataxin